MQYIYFYNLDICTYANGPAESLCYVLDQDTLSAA